MQKLTILFDLDGTLVDSAPDLMNAHNHVMRKFGFETKTTEDIRNLAGKGASVMIGRSIWGQAKKEFSKVIDEKIKKQMVKEFIDYYGKNIAIESKLIKGAKDFLDWSKKNNIQMGICTNKQEHLAINLLTDAESAKAAKIPFILLEDGYTDKKVSDIHHDYLIKNYDGIEEIINKFLID